MKKIIKIQILGFLLILFSTVSIYTLDSDSEQITIPLSNPNKSGLVIVNHYKGSINVTGFDGKTVVINAAYKNPEKNGDMKLIPNSSIKLSATQRDNIIIVNTNSHRKTIDLDINVPRNFSLKLSTYDNGSIVVNNVDGEFELNNDNGNVKLLNASGSAVISTIDGDIYADFLHINPDLPMVFSSVEGNINLALPMDVNIALKMKTEYGKIFSDFIINIDKRKSKIKKQGQNGSIKVTLEEWTYGKINKGGLEFLLKSLNGNIYIKKIK